MSCLENTRLEERLEEAFDIAIAEDRDLQNYIAHTTLEAWDYYRYCWDLVDWNDVWKKVLEEFYNSEGTCFDIRELVERAYDIVIDTDHWKE